MSLQEDIARSLGILEGPGRIPTPQPIAPPRPAPTTTETATDEPQPKTGRSGLVRGIQSVAAGLQDAGSFLERGKPAGALIALREQERRESVDAAQQSLRVFDRILRVYNTPGLTRKEKRELANFMNKKAGGQENAQLLKILETDTGKKMFENVLTEIGKGVTAGTISPVERKFLEATAEDDPEGAVKAGMQLLRERGLLGRSEEQQMRKELVTVQLSNAKAEQTKREKDLRERDRMLTALQNNPALAQDINFRIRAQAFGLKMPPLRDAGDEVESELGAYLLGTKDIRDLPPALQSKVLAEVHATDPATLTSQLSKRMGRYTGPKGERNVAILKQGIQLRAQRGDEEAQRVMIKFFDEDGKFDFIGYERERLLVEIAEGKGLTNRKEIIEKMTPETKKQLGLVPKQKEIVRETKDAFSDIQEARKLAKKSGEPLTQGEEETMLQALRSQGTPQAVIDGLRNQGVGMQRTTDKDVLLEPAGIGG